MKISVKPSNPEITVRELAKTGGFAKYFGDIVYIYPEAPDLSYYAAYNFTENKPYSFKSTHQVEKIQGEITFTCP